MGAYKTVLLTTSAAPSQSPFFTSEKRPPLGIGFLISVLRNAGHKVFFLDNYLSPTDFLETDYLQRNQIDFIGIYANTICYRDTLRMLYKIEYMRQRGSWNGKVMIGGPHTTVALHTIPGFVDHVVQGEGEHAILDIIEGKTTERVVHYPRIENLDKLPMPAWDCFVTLPYNWHGELFPEDPVFTMNTSRGCPFHCTFCSVGSIWGKKYTYFSAERIVSDIEYLIAHHQAKGIYFREDNFTLNRKRLFKFCTLLIEKGLKIPWACETRISSLDRETVELMHNAGACGFYLGVESGSQRMLDFFKKGITVEQTRNAFALCHEYGIKTAASVVVGAPTETEEDLQQTIILLNDIKPEIKWPNVFVGIPDSSLYRFSLDNNLYELIDDRGLVYLKGHNDRAQKYYGKNSTAEIVAIDPRVEIIIEPKISVLMSVYNGEKFIDSAIRSILHQTFQDFEFIIIDDASTDSTPDILRKFTDPRFKISRNNENLGLTKSLNSGLSAARGEYIARMDADDISLPHRLEVQYDFLKNRPEYALVGSSYYKIDEEGNIISLVPVLTSDQEIRTGLKAQNWFCHGSVLMRKESLVASGGYNERFIYSQDYDLWLRMSESFLVANIEEPLYSWRVTSDCISRDKEFEQQEFARSALGEARLRSLEFSAKPKVSVVVATYNRPIMLREALQSILSQTYGNIEIIVVNDSGIEVENIINELNKRNTIIYLKHDKNKGLAASRNTGIKASSGKYIAYLDDDDIFYPNHIATLVSALEGSDYKIAYTDAYRANQTLIDGSYTTISKDIPYSIDFSKDLLLVHNISPVNCFIHEKSCLEHTGLFDEELTSHEDWDLWIRLSRYYDFKHIRSITAEFRSRSDGSSMTSSMVSDFHKTMKVIYGKYHEHVNDKPHLLEKQKENLEALKRRTVEKNFTYTCSIIIPVFNKVEFTKQCLEALAQNTPGELFEVIIVDNASNDGTHEFLECLEGDVTVITNETNLGFAKACNQGACAANGKYLVFLNNDTIPHPDWLTCLIHVADEREDIGVVGSKLLFPDGTIQHAGVVLVDTPSGKLGRHLYWGRPGDFPPANRARDFQVVTAACMLIHKGLFFDINGFDERYVNGMEDVDLCLKVRNSGKRVYYCPNSVLTHFESKSEGRFDRVTENERLFVQIWNHRVETDETKYLIEDGFRVEQENGKASWVYHEELSNKLLSVIISVKNSLSLLKETVDSIISCASMPVEIIAVDNCSKDGSLDGIKTLPHVSAVFLKEEDSATGCKYPALEKAKGDYIAFMDSGVHVTKGWDTRFILGFSENVGAVTAVVHDYNDVQNFRDILRNPVKGDLDPDYISTILAKWNKDNRLESGPIDSRCFMIKRGTNEETMVLAWLKSGSKSNADLTTRMMEAGYGIVRVNSTLVYTHELSLCDNQTRITSPERRNMISKLLGIPMTSIIILTFNQLRFTKDCLKSVYQHTNIPFELILVDNGSTDDTRDYLINFAQANKNVELIFNDNNLGFAAGCNQGLRKVHGDYVLLLNNDVIVTEGWLEKLISHLEQSPDIGMAGPVSNSVSGDQLVEKVPYGKSIKGMQKFARNLSIRNSGKTTGIVRLVGFCLLIRKEVIEVIGGLDENYLSGNFEDDDLCLRSYIAGYKNIIAHDVFIHHYGSMTFKGNAIDYQATMKRNLRYFADKWKNIVEINGNGYRICLTREQQLQKLLEWGENIFSQGDMHSAVRIFKRTLYLDHTNTQALNNLGVIQWQIGEPLSAMKIFQSALRINRNNPDALANLLHVATETGRFDLIDPTLLDSLKPLKEANLGIDDIPHTLKENSSLCKTNSQESPALFPHTDSNAHPEGGNI